MLKQRLDSSAIKQPRFVVCALLLAAVLGGCGDANDVAVGDTELEADVSALTIPASPATTKAHSIVSWVMSGTGDSRQVHALDVTGAVVAMFDLQPEDVAEGARLDVTLTREDVVEHLKLASDGTVSGEASSESIEVLRSLHHDLKDWRPNQVNQQGVEAGDSKIHSTSQALTYGCGSAIGRGDSVRCGTVFLGESRICMTNLSGSQGAAYVDYYGTTFGVTPYGQTCLVRWYWGADIYISNTSYSAVLQVSH